jgi:hypothetical protein
MCRIAVLHAVAAACLVSMPAAVRAQAFTQPQADAAVERALPLLQSSAKTWHEKRACFSCHHQGLGILAVAVARERGFNIDAEMLADEVRKSARPPGTRDRLLLREISFNEQITDGYIALAQASVRTPRTIRCDARCICWRGASTLTDTGLHVLTDHRWKTVISPRPL